MTDTPATLQALLARVESAAGPDRELDETIAESLLGVTKWKSKHGYWNVDFPKDYPFTEYGQRSVMTTLGGRSPDYEFDPATGAKLPPEVPPSGWADDVEVSLPEYTASIDAALALVERRLPKDDWAYGLWSDYGGLRRCHINVSAGCEGWPSGGLNADADAETIPLAILAALLKALIANNA